MPKLPKATQELAATVSPEALASARVAINKRAASLRLHCADDYAELTKSLAAGANPRTIVAVLADPAIEAVVADIVQPAKVEVRQGFFARLFGRGGK
jgi:hypothetical protein